MYNCEFAWSFNGFTGVASDFGQATEVELVDCLFHDNSDTHLDGDPGAFGIGTFGGLWVKDCVFGHSEDGTAPSKHVDVGGALDVGIFTGNRFATATNANTTLIIGAKIFWVANATEAGWSTARPA